MDEPMKQEPGAPPVAPGPVRRPPRQSNWPMVLGIISCVLGGLAALGGCFGAGSMVFVELIADAMPPEAAEQFELMTQHMWFYVGSSVVYLVLGVLLGVSGIGMLQRRPWCRPTILLWSVLKILYAVGSSFMNYQIQMQWAEAMQTDPSFQSAGGMMMPMMGVFGVLGIVFGILWYSALPMFTIIWFLRPKIRREVRSWSEDGDTA